MLIRSAEQIEESVKLFHKYEHR